MKEIFIKNKKLIFRSLGVLFLIVGFIVYFWTTPKKGFTQNEIAAANVARMEAHAMRSTGNSKKSSKSSSAKILEELKNTQAKQREYLTIVTIIFGIGFLGYSFVNAKNDSEQ
ncbi:hypothetical protein HUE87_01560 [Candidatus Sulfurimonas marisnigri]|uniref:Uncharacterized protein n=1 Tax=Candidatus Sulfurimonas marisnigri TaxID=2740405 RepID=A0A7S7RQT4_9BACT|nr:hypothetical protein [Candidatus Sulfurimonas marisnigri]QOY54959.1 hypothetical protein HUE87_01560 [Candidatus Sulfurimonas marisnigri]